jgi:hypothetical protein
MFVASSALNSTYLCAPERTKRSTKLSAPSARRGPERSRQNCRLIEPLGVAGEQYVVAPRRARASTGAPNAGKRNSACSTFSSAKKFSSEASPSRIAARRSRSAEEGTSHPTPPGDSANAPNAPPYASAGSRWSTDLPARAAALRRGTEEGDGVSRGRRARDRDCGLGRVPSGATGTYGARTWRASSRRDPSRRISSPRPRDGGRPSAGARPRASRLSAARPRDRDWRGVVFSAKFREKVLI